MELEKLFNSYAALKEGERISVGQKAFQEMSNNLMALGYKKGEIVSFACMLVRLAAGADSYASEKEFDLFSKVTKIEMDKYEFFNMLKNGDEESFVASIDEIVDQLNRAAKDAALSFVAIFLSADNQLSEKEKELFKRLEA